MEVIGIEIQKSEAILKELINASPEFCLVFMNALVGIQTWMHMQDVHGVTEKLDYQTPLHFARLTGQLDFVNYLTEIRDALAEANKKEDEDDV